jgi:transcription elongation factor Elf1
LKSVTKERAERIAKGHACENCGEYSFKRVAVKPAPAERLESENVAWLAERHCGVCGAEMELGIAPDGAIVYST